MRKSLLGLAMLLAAAVPSFAQSSDGVTLAILNDQSSSFSALGGTEVVAAVDLAIHDFGGQVLGKPIKLLNADHQNKPDVALSIAREWFERDHVDAIVDVANSAIALGINNLLKEKKKIGLFISPITDRMTEEDCNGYGLAWAYDSYSIVRASVNAQLARGGDTWYVLSPDYEAGKVIEETVKSAVTEGGGKIVGAVRAPLGTTDFSSYILQAQASGAKVVALTFNGPELVNSLKQVQEFGLIAAGQRVAVTILHQSDVRSIGLAALKGIQLATPWHWNADAASVHFKDDMEKKTGHAPGWVAAANYSAVMNYLRAVADVGSTDPDKVVAKLRATKINDFFARNATLWPNGRLIHDMYLVEVNKPGEFPDPENAFKTIANVPADKAFRPLAQSKCPLVNK